MAAVQLLSLAMLLGVSIWVGLDARKRGMSARWGVGVGLLLIIFLPLYFLVRKPLPTVKCTSCGKDVDESLELCWDCGQPVTPSAALGAAESGRPDRILG